MIWRAAQIRFAASDWELLDRVLSDAVFTAEANQSAEVEQLQRIQATIKEKALSDKSPRNSRERS